MYVLMCPCILNPDLRARGITKDSDLDMFSGAIERCRRFGLEIVPLPCPECIYLGPDREPGTFLDRLDTEEFREFLLDLEREVREIIEKRGLPLCLVGVNSSPTCGVDTTYFGSHDGKSPKIPGRGTFLARLSEIQAIDVGDFARYRLYLAAPLFSRAEKLYNLSLNNLLTRSYYEVYLPQDVGDDTHTRSLDEHRMIFESHVTALDEADAVVAVIDGADADSGTSWEMGYAYSIGKPVYAIRTDFRMAGKKEKVNLMLEQSSDVVTEEIDLLSALKAPGAGR
ncbi:MAG TPA: nucleoside 2-deoxyribosyltransferase [Methanoregulaceae archaeon]|nr:nucleoside 2-deoxyribosyltransferase [Methanoregulaceae archaeon]